MIELTTRDVQRVEQLMSQGWTVGLAAELHPVFRPDEHGEAQETAEEETVYYATLKKVKPGTPFQACWDDAENWLESVSTVIRGQGHTALAAIEDAFEAAIDDGILP